MECFPNLPKTATRCFLVSTYSVDNEQSFSNNKNVLQNERRSLNTNNLTKYNIFYQKVSLLKKNDKVK